MQYEIIKEEKDGTPVEVKILKDENTDIKEKAPIYLGTLENGERNPSVDVLLKLSAALGVTIDELVDNSEKDNGAA